MKPEELRAAVADIDEETARLNRLVSEVLDFARPIKFDLAPADLNALCEDAAKAAAGSDARPPPSAWSSTARCPWSSPTPSGCGWRSSTS